MTDTTKILSFLQELEQNNTREWFHANKPARDEAHCAFQQFLQELLAALSVADHQLLGLNPKELIFRLNRDTRFAKHLPPYKTAFSAHLSPAGRVPIPVGYFVCIQQGNSFIGGGHFAAQFSQATTMIRDYIIEKPAEFLRIIVEPAFQKHFTLIGEKLKNAPRGYDPTHDLIEYLKHKAWAIEYHFSDEEVADSETLLTEMTEKFLLMQDFNAFLNRALINFHMPERR